LKLSITNVFVALYYCVTTLKLDMNILCSFISVVPKLNLQRMTLSLAMAAFASHEVAASNQVHGDWTDGPFLDTRIHEGSEKSAVAGYCLHHPGHPHRREPAIQLVMFSLVLHVLIFMSGLKIRYSAYLVNSN